MRTFGWIPSKIDNSISIYKKSDPSDQTVYKRIPVTPIIDQGQEGSCVSQTCYELYGFYKTVILGDKKNDITPTWVYKKRSNKGEEGMMCSDAFQILVKEGKIKGFAKINSLESVKHAILTFGGVLLAVKVYNSLIDDFWEGKKLEGGHAICAIGYDEDYLYFKNSWGRDYGSNGLWKFPTNKFYSKVCEAWTITF